MSPKGIELSILGFYKPAKSDDPTCKFKEDERFPDGNELPLALASSNNSRSLNISTEGIRGKCNYVLDEVHVFIDRIGSKKELLNLFKILSKRSNDALIVKYPDIYNEDSRPVSLPKKMNLNCEKSLSGQKLQSRAARIQAPDSETEH